MYHAIVNVPGYLSDSDPVEFGSIRAAWMYLAEERQRGEDHQEVEGIETDPDVVNALWDEALAAEPTCGVVYGLTPGHDPKHDLGLAYSVTPVE